MYLVMQRMNDRTGDHGIEVKDTNQPSTSGVKREEKGKGPALGLIGVETIPEIMSVAKRTRSATAEPEPSSKKGKHVPFELSPQPEKKKRKPRRRYKTSDLRIGRGQRGVHSDG